MRDEHAQSLFLALAGFYSRGSFGRLGGQGCNLLLMAVNASYCIFSGKFSILCAVLSHVNSLRRCRCTRAILPFLNRGCVGLSRKCLQLAEVFCTHWNWHGRMRRSGCGGLSGAQIHARPAGLPSVSFQLRHIAGSLDRLLTYAEGRALSEEQLQTLKSEARPEGSAQEMLSELEASISRASLRIRALSSEDLALPRAVGTKRLPTTLGGLLVHIADHTQRHVGQAITTAKLVSASKVF